MALSNSFLLTFAIISIVLLLGMFVVLFIFLRRTFLSKSVRIMILSKDRTLNTYRRKNIGSTFTIGDKTYAYDSLYEVKRKFWKEIYYLEDIPNPINYWDIDENELENTRVGKIRLSATNLKNTITRAIYDNISKRNDTMPLMLILFVIAILLIVNAYFGFQTMQGVSIADTIENKDLILKWITGGS